MTQELTDLRNYILDGRYEDALTLLDELEGMSKKATMRTIRSYAVRLLVHLIKNQVEQRLTNSWAASIRDSVLEIQDLNLKSNQNSYYINADEWEDFLETALEDAVFAASAEVAGGIYKPARLMEMINQDQIINLAQKMLNLTYNQSGKLLRRAINEEFAQLPGGEEWNLESS
ncbi:MAG TPA: DUF29 family protein [Oscillatoriaceae cyanobacterium M33_DOE_052]|uniref:DUF29 family protein n=1 Tax=Planktothricoides sp. SpSt-374 TaxID=2282167 RepID=A0A7C3VNK6_9CYAN|nr:DUF29 family protein [Oscillatoriaceae cyanobacterium M33_DOE_052]